MERSFCPIGSPMPHITHVTLMRNKRSLCNILDRSEYDYRVLVNSFGHLGYRIVFEFTDECKRGVWRMSLQYEGHLPTLVEEAYNKNGIPYGELYKLCMMGDTRFSMVLHPENTSVSPIGYECTFGWDKAEDVVPSVLNIMKEEGFHIPCTSEDNDNLSFMDLQQYN